VPSVATPETWRWAWCQRYEWQPEDEIALTALTRSLRPEDPLAKMTFVVVSALFVGDSCLIGARFLYDCVV
jgi:hypothetical protein